MCGIAGIVSPSRPASEVGPVLERMIGSMIHRGPDSSGSRIENGVAIGMRRLSIIDLATGDQPIPNETNDIWVIQNGEIYNFLELRDELEKKGHSFRTRSDTEVLVHGWEQWGEGMVERLNGMFAFAVWDSRRKLLFLARDRMGIKPLYWAVKSDALLFGSELKAICASGMIEADLDEVSLGQFLVFEYVPAPRSIIAGVNKLEAASWLSSEAGRVKTHRYWNLSFEPDRSGTFQERIEEVIQALERAARLELVSDVPIGVLTSGGVDSSAVALAVTRVSSEPPKTFTVGFDDRSFDESSYARDVASLLGTDHHDTRLRPYEMNDLIDQVASILDEPLADSSLLPTYLLARFTRQHVKVALGGDGGDELWGGYPTMLAHRFARFYRRLPSWIHIKLVAPAANRLPTSFNNISMDFRAKRFVQGMNLAPELQHQLWVGGYSPERVRWLLPSIDSLKDEVLFDPVLRLLPLASTMEPMDRILYLDASLYLEGDILTKVDRASMACSLEVRVPLLNREVVDVARRVPFEWKLRGTRGKYILRRAIGPWLPKDVAARKKKGFNIPISKWLRGEHRGLLDQLILKPPSFTNSDRLKLLIRQHLEGTHDHRKLLWPLVVLSIWEDTWGSKVRAMAPTSNGGPKR